MSGLDIDQRTMLTAAFVTRSSRIALPGTGTVVTVAITDPAVDYQKFLAAAPG